MVLSVWLLTGCVVLTPADWNCGDDCHGDGTLSTSVIDTTIEALQHGEIATGERVSLTGLAAHQEYSDGVFLQTGGPGPYTGIWVEASGFEMTGYAQGDELRVTGTYSEKNAFSTVVVEHARDVEFLGHGATLASATQLTEDLLGDDVELEPYEAMLVQVQDARVVEVDTDSHSFEVSLPSGSPLKIDDAMYEIVEPLIDREFDRLTGLLAYVGHTWRLVPRDADDVSLVPLDEVADEPLALEELTAGDLVVTEFMADPEDCPGDRCEWIEVLVNTQESVDLAGLTLTIDGSVVGQVSESFVALPDELVIAALEQAEDWPLEEVTPDVYLSTVRGLPELPAVFSIGSDAAATVFDEVAYAAVNAQTGIAAQLDPTRLSATANDQAINWCPADEVMPGNGDLGTPGDENTDC